MLRDLDARPMKTPRVHHWTTTAFEHGKANDKARHRNTDIVQATLATLAVNYRLDQSRDEDLYILSSCPFSQMRQHVDHGESEKAWVKVAADGMISASC